MVNNLFKINKYLILKNIVSSELINFCYNYFILKRKVAKVLFDTKFISQYCDYFGSWDDPDVPNTYSHYSDVVMETLLVKLLPIIEKETGLKLNPNYSYARIYKKGDILPRHKDRLACEISSTMNLGGGCWPIYLEPDAAQGEVDEKTGNYKPSKAKGVKVMLEPGDMLVYRGNELEHWREKLTFDDCGQVFFHFNDIKNKKTKKYLYDGRPHLGLPKYFANKID